MANSASGVPCLKDSSRHGARSRLDRTERNRYRAAGVSGRRPTPHYSEAIAVAYAAMWPIMGKINVIYKTAST